MINFDNPFYALNVALILFACAFIFAVIVCIYMNRQNASMEKENRNNKIVGREACKFTSGDMRLGMGLYRTPEESNHYIKESLKRPLP